MNWPAWLLPEPPTPATGRVVLKLGLLPKGPPKTSEKKRADALARYHATKARNFYVPITDRLLKRREEARKAAQRDADAASKHIAELWRKQKAKAPRRQEG